MANTPRLTIPYPAPTDVPDGAAQIQAVATRLDAIAAWYVQGTLAARPAAGVQGKVYLATDTGEVAFDNGTQWLPLVPAASARLHDIGDLKTSIRTADHGGWLLADGRVLGPSNSPSLRAMLQAAGNPFGVTGSDPKIIDAKGRVMVSAGAGSGLTARTLGQSGGIETHPLAGGEMPAHTHAIPHTHTLSGNTGAALGTGDQTGKTFRFGDGFLEGHTHALLGNTQGVSTPNSATATPSGSGTGHPNMQPFVVSQVFIYGG